eukprot:402844_1
MDKALTNHSQFGTVTMGEHLETCTSFETETDRNRDDSNESATKSSLYGEGNEHGDTTGQVTDGAHGDDQRLEETNGEGIAKCVACGEKNSGKTSDEDGLFYYMVMTND